MINHFGTYGEKECVTFLREGHKCERSNKPEMVSINDIVLIYDKCQPRHLWKLGRILELMRSKDGLVRAAKVKCGSTGNIINQRLNKLYPIEIRNSSLNNENRNGNQEYDQSFNNENEGEGKPNSNVENEVMIVRRTLKRNAAIIGEIKRRYIDSD